MSRHTNKSLTILTLLALGLLPWGQLPGLVLDLAFKPPFTLHPLDAIATLSLLGTSYLIIVRRKSINSFPLANFLLIAVFSFIFSIYTTPLPQLTIGFSYLVRFAGYLALSFLIRLGIEDKQFSSSSLLNSLLLITVIIAIIGWIQYLLTPDIRFMKTLGWDDHYFRITSFLLDPGFAGIVLVLGLVIALQKRRLPLILGFIMTILLTYSRASYLAAMAGCGYLLLRKIRVQNTVKILAIILLSLFFLPRPAGEGVNLLRTRSISARALNYAQTFEIIETNPLFGIGFNNICFAKHKLDPGLKSVNSCSGADNSFLFVLATTGLVGGVIFIHEILKLVKGTSHDEFGEIFKGSGVALLTHSFFSNTIFYISTMAWFAILIAISRGAHHRE